MKTCTKCLEVKHESEYNKHKMGKGGLSARCRKCDRARVKEYNKLNPREFSESRVNRTWWRRGLHGARNKAMARCKKKGIPFSVSHQHLVDLFNLQEGRCCLSGLEFREPKEGKSSPFSMSIDRREPNLGYVEGNVRLMLMGVNSMKLSGSDEDVISICKAVVDLVKELEDV